MDTASKIVFVQKRFEIERGVLSYIEQNTAVQKVVVEVGCLCPSKNDQQHGLLSFSPLRSLHTSTHFRQIRCDILGIPEVYELLSCLRL